MLNPRLDACAAYVQKGGVVCDVGTDHAILAVHLVEAGIAKKVIASDIGEGPLAAAERTIAKHGLQAAVQTILSDGLAQVPPEGITDIVIAGMGGETMIHILETCPWSLEQVRLILQPMTKADVLREWLYAHGFAIVQETCAREDKFYYAVMQVVYTGLQRAIDPLTKRIGKMQLSQEDCRAYAQRQYAQVCAARDGREQAGMDASEFADAAEALRIALEE